MFPVNLKALSIVLLFLFPLGLQTDGHFDGAPDAVGGTAPSPYSGISEITARETGGPAPLGIHAIQVRNPSSFSRDKEVVRLTLNLPDGELTDETKFTVNGTGGEVRSGSLASTVVRYPSNSIRKMDIVFQDDFLPSEVKNYDIITGQSTGFSAGLTFLQSTPYFYVNDAPWQYQIQTFNDLNHFDEGVGVTFINGSYRSTARILVRVSGDQLMLDQGIIHVAWGTPTYVNVDYNNVMFSVHLIYSRPFMVHWGPSWSTTAEILRNSDILYADVTINIYNDRPMIETFCIKRFNEKLYNHNGVVEEFSAMYDGDGDYLAIIGNGVHTERKISSRITTWELVDNAYAGIDVGNYSVPAFADLNGDGLKDMVLGMENGTLAAYLNTGTAASPVWTYDDTVYLGIDVDDRSAPILADLDADGDNDTAVGNMTGELQYFENTGTPFAPAWTPNPAMFAGIAVNNASKPELADIDGDGDLDLTIGMGNGNISHYENTGTPAAPIWTANNTAFQHLSEGLMRIPTSFVKTDTRFSAPTFADVDSDGDLDFSSGFEFSYYNLLSHFENLGDATNPQFTRFRPDLFATVRGYAFDKFHSVPRFVDMDGDGLFDLIFGAADGNLSYFQNKGPLGRGNMPIYNMQPLENGSYRFYIDQDSNDGPYSIDNYSSDFNGYYVLAKPSSGRAVFRYVPDFDRLVYRDRYSGDQYLWAGGNVSYYPFLPDEDGYVTRGILIARGFSGSGISKGISGGTFLSQTGTAGGFQQVAMTAMNYVTREVLVTEAGYSADYSVYDALADRMGTPMEVIISPDLMVDSKYITFDPGVAGDGDLVTINATVHNIGGQTANGVDVEFYHGSISPPNLIFTKTITSIAPGASEYAGTTWDSTGHQGTNLFFAVVDPSNSIAELDEQNNNANKSLEVLAWRLGKEEFQLTTDSNASSDPTVAVDSSGRVWVAYHTYTHRDDFEVFARSYDGSWSSEQLLGADTKRTSRPFLTSRGSDVWLTYTSNAVEVAMYNSTRNAQYYWAMKFDLYAKRFDGVSWLPTERLTQSVLDNDSDEMPSAIIDDSGKLWIGARNTSFDLYALPGEQITNMPSQDMNITGFTYDGAWTGPFYVSAQAGSEGWYGGAVLALDGAGRVWYIFERELNNVQWEIFGRYWDGSSWSSLIRITDDVDNDYRPSAIRDGSGRLWVAWESNRDGNKEIYIKSYNGTSWTGDTRLTNDSGHDIRPYMTADAFGNVWVVWETDRDGNKNIYLKRFDGSSWSPDIPLTSDAGSDECPFLANDPTTGDLWLAWETDRNGHGNKDVYAMRLFLNDTSAPATTLTIGDPKYVSANTYVLSSTPFTLSADDGQGAGIRGIWYRTWNATDGWTQWTGYSSPFTISGADGLYYIEYNSTDNLGASETPNNQTVHLDNSYPITSMTPGSPVFISGGVMYFNSSTLFTITANDGSGSGVNHTWYRVWESSIGWSPFVMYGAPFTFSGADGIRYVECNSTDHIGNAEPLKNCTSPSELYLDNSPPTTSLTIGLPQNISGGVAYFNSSTPFTLSPSDAGSGLAGTWYSVWDATTGWVGPTPYSGPFTISGPDGPRYVEYNSTDNLGQAESPNNYSAISELYLDNGAPTTTINIGVPSYTGANTYVTSVTSIVLSATDSSGVDDIWFAIDAGSWTAYSASFQLTSEGAHTIYYNATDVLDQSEVTISITLFVDDTPPTTTLEIGAPNYTAPPIFVESSTTFTLTADDSGGSGVSATFFEIDGQGYTQYFVPFTLSGFPNGAHTLKYYSRDNLGNTELSSSRQLYLDDLPPTARAGGDAKVVLGSTVSFSGASSGDNSGVITNYTWNFTYNGQPEVMYGVAPSYKFDLLGSYEVTLQVRDYLGHGSTDTVWINVTSANDSDSDGLDDNWELNVFGNLDQVGSNDTDGDGLNNSQEYALETDPNEKDSDSDGLEDGEEINLGTNPKNDDTDGDGLKDGDDPEPLTPAKKEDVQDNTMLFMLIAAVVIIVVVLVLALLLRRRKGKQAGEVQDEEHGEEETGDEPAPEDAPEEGISEEDGASEEVAESHEEGEETGGIEESDESEEPAEREE